MTRRRRSALRRWWDRIAKGLRYWTEPAHARRVDGAKKAARTRRERALAANEKPKAVWSEGWKAADVEYDMTADRIDFQGKPLTVERTGPPIVMESK